MFRCDKRLTVVNLYTNHRQVLWNENVDDHRVKSVFILIKGVEELSKLLHSNTLVNLRPCFPPSTRGGGGAGAAKVTLDQPEMSEI